ncbi:hypothetical protein [Nocardia salmonicida]|uniref:hypothetical protein n=1 Tax=Nocardia salmonicida TaxID=53431 RepID=UPI002E2E5618|nr:hypothetical protein [Nocardia salmonicida]
MFVEAIGSQVLSAATASALTASAGAARWLLASRLPARRTWRFSNVSGLEIVLDTDYIDTGHYQRPVAGLGQIRGLSLLIPSLTRAYRDIEFDKVWLSAHLPGDRIEQDLLVLGGPKNNEVAARILAAMEGALPFRSADGIVWEGDAPRRAEQVDGSIVRDYGYIVRTSNPLNPARRVVLIGGASTYGTIAASRWLAENGADRSLPADVAILVEASVVQGEHVSAPSLLRHAPITAVQ